MNWRSRSKEDWRSRNKEDGSVGVRRIVALSAAGDVLVWPISPATDAIKGISVQDAIFKKITSTQACQNSVRLLICRPSDNEFGTEA